MRPPGRVAVAAALAAGVGAVALGWWATATSTADARIAALLTVEPYAMAVHEQLASNFAHHGRFFQTIHRGYDDAWTWSGHRAATFPVAAFLYGLGDSPFWLARIQVGGVLLGAVPAALLGRRALGRAAGLAMGALVYLLCPAVMALALQDYQDLVFALPALVFAAWAFSTGRVGLAVLGAGVAVLPREECIPLAVAMAVVAPLPRREGRLAWPPWFKRVFLAAAVAGGWAWALDRFFPVGQGHDVPMMSTLADLAGLHGPVFLDGWPRLGDFYLLLFVPFGAFALLAPGSLLVALGLVLVHMTVPAGHGVDRSWTGHAHHLAPAAAFAVVAAIVGLGRAGRLLARVPGGRGLALLGAAGLLAWALRWDAAWGRQVNLVLSFRTRAPAWWHPGWRLAERLPDDAVPAVPKDLSLTVSHRSVAYTYDESLADKAPRRGLGAATCAIVDTRQEGVLDWALAMRGARVVAEDGPFSLVAWEPGAVDRRWMRVRDARFSRPRPWTGPFRRRQDIPGVPPFVREGEVEGVPVLRFPWTDETTPRGPRVVPRGGAEDAPRPGGRSPAGGERPPPPDRGGGAGAPGR